MIMKCQRIDIRYDAREDRLCLDLASGPTMHRYFVTARLTKALVTTLLNDTNLSHSEGWVKELLQLTKKTERINTGEIRQEESVERLLLEQVNIRRNNFGLALTLLSGTEQKSEVVMTQANEFLFLRGIFLKFLEADWDLSCWPNILTSHFDNLGASESIH